MLSGSIKSHQKRRWHFLNALGLEKAFAPALVCETVTKDRNGDFEITATASDGRVLGVFKPKSRKGLILHSTKFSSPWSSCLDMKRRADKLCYLSEVVSEHGLPKEAIKPLVRLSSQYNRLGWINFKKLIRCVISKVAQKSNTKVRQLDVRRSRKHRKPSITRGVEVLPTGRLVFPRYGWRCPYSGKILHKEGNGPAVKRQHLAPVE